MGGLKKAWYLFAPEIQVHLVEVSVDELSENVFIICVIESNDSAVNYACLALLTHLSAACFKPVCSASNNLHSIFITTHLTLREKKVCLIYENNTEQMKFILRRLC